MTPRLESRRKQIHRPCLPFLILPSSFPPYQAMIFLDVTVTWQETFGMIIYCHKAAYWQHPPVSIKSGYPTKDKLTINLIINII